MNRLEVLLVGQISRPEFRAVLPSLSSAVRCRQVETLSDGYSLLKEKGVLPDVILLLQAYPGQFSASQLGRLRALVPLTPVVVVLGPWSEGEGRSGQPLPGTWRIYWHQWPARWGQQLRRWQEGKCPIWGLPATSIEEDRIALPLSPAAQAHKARCIGLFSLRPSQADWLFAGLKLWGLQPIWIPGPRGPWASSSILPPSNSPHSRGIPELDQPPADCLRLIRQARPIGVGDSVPPCSGQTDGPICSPPFPNLPLAGSDEASGLFGQAQGNPPPLRPFRPEPRPPNPCFPEPGSPAQVLPEQGSPEKVLPEEGFPDQFLLAHGLPDRTSLTHRSLERSSPAQGFPHQSSPEQSSLEQSSPEQTFLERACLNQCVPEEGFPEQDSSEQRLPGGIFPFPPVRTVVFDGTDAEGEEAVWLGQLSRWLPGADIVLLVDFPRPELWDRLHPWRVKTILGKPILLGDLVWHLDQLENKGTI